MKERIGLLVVVAFTVVLWILVAGHCEGAIEDCIDATCRISDGQGKPLGTGSVFRHAKGRVYVLTNAHVVEGHQTVACEFWQRGHQSKPLLGSVAWQVRNDECDAAIVTLNEAQFKGFLPTVIPLAPPDYLVRPGETLVSVGCARGAWATAWRGHAKGYVGTDLRFLPTPAGGRSGSAIFNADGSQIVGLLFAREADDSEGMAVSLQALYKHLQETVGASTGTPADTARELCQATWGVPTPREWKPAPGVCGGVFGECPGGAQCPNGQCPPQKPNRQFQLFGKQEYQGSPYPSLPIPSPSAQPAPLVPVSMPDAESRARLDVLEREVAVLREARAEASRSADALAARWRAEDAADAVAETEATTAKEEVEGLKGKVAEAVKEVGGIRGVIDKVQAGEIDGIRAVVKGVLLSYGWPGALIGLVVGYFIFDLYRKVKTGDKLAIEKIRERLHDRMEPLRDRLHDRAESLDIPLVDRLLKRIDSLEARLHPEPESTPARKK